MRPRRSEDTYRKREPATVPHPSPPRQYGLTLASRKLSTSESRVFPASRTDCIDTMLPNSENEACSSKRHFLVFAPLPAAPSGGAALSFAETFTCNRQYLHFQQARLEEERPTGVALCSHCPCCPGHQRCKQELPKISFPDSSGTILSNIYFPPRKKNLFHAIKVFGRGVTWSCWPVKHPCCLQAWMQGCKQTEPAAVNGSVHTGCKQNQRICP